MPTLGSTSRDAGSSAPDIIDLTSDTEDTAPPACVPAAGEGAKPKVDPDIKPKCEGNLPSWILDLNDSEWTDVERAEIALGQLDDENCKSLIDYLQKFFEQATDAITEAQRLGRRPSAQVWTRALNIADRHLRDSNAGISAAARSFYGAYFKSKSFPPKRAVQR